MKKRLLVIFLGLLCVVSLSGCKYMRLLQFKSQFQNFPKYFVFIKSPTKPGVLCLHPLLIPDDILLLSDGVSPSVVKTTEGVTTWAFIMKKDSPPSDTTPSVLTISLEFNAKNQLTTAFYPSQFSAIFHPDFVPQLLERVGAARFLRNGFLIAVKLCSTWENLPLKSCLTMRLCCPISTPSKVGLGMQSPTL
jgi:hypothetical protein